MEIKIEIGQWGGSKREPRTLRNYSEVLKLYAKLNGHAYISTPSGPQRFQLRDLEEKGKLFVWSYGRSCWDDNVCTDIPTWQKCSDIAQRYNRLKKWLDLHNRQQQPGLRKCPKCGEMTLEISNQPYGIQKECVSHTCDHRDYFSIGD